MTVNDSVQLPPYLPLEWVAKPENVHAYSTLISAGVSTGDYAEYNLAAHVGDEPTAVEANREKLMADLELFREPIWLEQVHSNKVFLADDRSAALSSDAKTTQVVQRVVPQADASVTSSKDLACVVLTADCLPVFFCNSAGSEVAVAHAGWRGLHAGIISKTIKTMKSSPSDILISLGPAIGPQAFEVGAEVRQAFVDKNRDNKMAFSQSRQSHYLCDIYQLARLELQSVGVSPCQIAGGDYCTYSEKKRFYSFRRQQNTGRMANLIWLT